MKEILLTQGKVALVDDDMYEYLNQWKWHTIRDRNTWYAIRVVGPRVFRKKIFMHRVVCNAPDGILIDHWDKNGLNNQRGNLRFCTVAENARNRGKNKNNSTGYKGVSRAGWGNKYQAQIIVNSKQINLGYFSTAEDAARAYDDAARKHHGSFARTNF